MKRIKAGLLALALACAAPVPAPAAAQPQTAAERQAVADMQAWMTAMGEFATAYQRFGVQSTDTLMFATSGADLFDLIESGRKPAELRAWTTDWRAQMDRRMEADRASYIALPTTVPPWPDTVPQDSATRRRIANMALLPDRFGAFHLRLQQSLINYADLVEAAASGEEDDVLRMVRGGVETSVAAVEAENVLLIAQADGPVSEPRAEAIIASNKAMIAWLYHVRDVRFELPNDPAAVATTIREHATVSRAAIRRMLVDMDEVFADTLANPLVQNSPLRGRLVAIMDGIRQSAVVENRVADEMDNLAHAVEAGDMDAQIAVATGMESLIDQRMAAQERMVAAMSQPGE